ncbi:MAG TPA: ABC transporter permease [Anaerolineae bacterium]|nr:ABC transporter permease [Anaerolineae bacterium]
MKLKQYARVVAAAAEMSLRQTIRDSFVVFTFLIYPLIVAWVGLWMLRDRIENYAIFVVVGSGMTALWSGVLTVSGNNITGERWAGTLELLVGAPTPLPVIVFGKNLANVVLSFSSMLVGYAVISLASGYPLRVEQPGLFALSVLFTLISFVAFGLILAPLFLVNPEVRAWQNALEFPVYILGGFLFPITLLPGWTTPLSYVLAPYWAARALHGTSSGGAALSEVAFYWAMMLLLAVIYTLIAVRLFRVMLHRVRADATLGLE